MTFNYFFSSKQFYYHLFSFPSAGYLVIIDRTHLLSAAPINGCTVGYVSIDVFRALKCVFIKISWGCDAGPFLWLFFLSFFKKTPFKKYLFKTKTEGQPSKQLESFFQIFANWNSIIKQNAWFIFDILIKKLTFFEIIWTILCLVAQHYRRIIFILPWIRTEKKLDSNWVRFFFQNNIAFGGVM